MLSSLALCLAGKQEEFSTKEELESEASPLLSA
jgi:hypothetical protein